MSAKKQTDTLLIPKHDNSCTTSVYIESRNQVSNKGWRNLLLLLKEWRISELFIQGQLSNEHAIYQILRERKDRSLEQIKLVYQFDFNLQSFINKNRDSLSKTLLSLIYSTCQYYSHFKSWGKEIQKIYGWQPEIMRINVTKKSILREIDDPATVHSVIKIWDNKGKRVYEDVTPALNKDSGRIRLPVEQSDFFLLIIRSAKILNDNSIQYFMNFFSEDQLQAAQKHFIKSLLPKGIQEYGVYYDLKKIIPFEGQPHWIFSSEEIEKEVGNELSIAFASMIMNDYKATFRYSEVIRKIRDRLLISTFPSLESLSDTVYFKADTSFPFPLNSLPKNVYFEVNEDLFVQPTPYYWETIKKLRLNKILPSQIEHTLTIQIHDLMNINYSFSEKKYQIDQLLLFGGDKISFRLAYPWFERLLQLSEDIGKIDPNLSGYNNWFNYLDQLTGFLSNSQELCDILVLNPTPESESKLLHQTMQHLNQFGISYLLLDIDRFEDHTICKFEENYLRLSNQKFRVILLPGLTSISLEALKKIHRFMKNGGIAVCLSQLPQYASRPENQSALNRLKENMWLDEYSSSVTLYRLGKSGGVGYFIPKISDFNTNIPEFSSNLKLKVQSGSGNVVHSLRETDDNYFLFMMNLNGFPEKDVTIDCSYPGDVYSWDFDQQQAIPYPFWQSGAEDNSIIQINLAAGESRLLIINKTSNKKVVHIGNSCLDGVESIKHRNNKISIHGWQRAEGNFTLTALTGQKETKLEYQIKNKLPILELSPDNWYLESGSFKSKVSLGDHSAHNDHSCEPLIYHKLIMIGQEYTANTHLILQLGQLNHWCQIYINDIFVGQALYPPWQFAITDRIKAGQNKFSIKIISNLSNMMADELNRTQLNYPVQEFGLFGPVSIIPYNKVEIKT